MKDRALGPAHLGRWRVVLPNAQVHELAESGHWPQETEPERVASVF